MSNGTVPTNKWTTWAKDLRLEKFNAAEWVALAQKCGYRYIVVTTKHHEGFHMWDTEFSDFKVTNTPFGRDYLKELTDACHAAKMPIGFYYSQRDFYHPDYQPVDHAKAETVGQYWWKLKPGETSPLGPRHKDYIEYQFKVCRELCTKYGRIDFWWWDAVSLGGMFTAEMWDAEKLTRLVRELQPHIVMNNRCSVPGDFDTPEQRLGTYQDWRAWETCMPIQADGGWAFTGAPVKPLAKRIHILVNNACGDGNTLMSWGPHWDGAFDDDQIKAQLEMADWLKRNGTSVYGTRGGPWKTGAWGGSTRRDNKAWLHVTKWAGETLRLPPLPERAVQSARLLGGESVAFEQSGGTLTITVPQARQDSTDTIIELTFDKPVVGLKTVDASKGNPK
jgi:alpha-L-fucosidase